MNIFHLSYTSIILLSAVAVATFPATASEHKHEHKDGKQHSMQLDDGKKWSIDASLHIGMNSIKTSMETNISPIHYKKFTSDQYISLAGEINIHLAYLFENCKLPTKADAQLHVLLFKIMQGNEEMQSTNNKRDGAIKIIKALGQYPQYFDDKNWQALQH